MNLPPPPSYSSFLPPPPPPSSSKPPIPPSTPSISLQSNTTPSASTLSNDFLELTNVLGINSLHANQFIVTKCKEIIFYISNNIVVEFSLKLKKQLSFYYSSNGNLISSISLSSDEKFLIIGEKNEQSISSSDPNNFISIIIYNLNYYSEKKIASKNVTNTDKKLVVGFDKKSEKYTEYYYNELYTKGDEKTFNEEYFDDYYDNVLHQIHESSTFASNSSPTPSNPPSSISVDLPPHHFYPNSSNVIFNEKTSHIHGISCLKLIKIYNKKLKKFHHLLISVGFVNDKQLLIWDVENRIMIKKYKINKKIYNISYNSSLNYFITCGDRHLKWWYIYEVTTPSSIDDKFIDSFSSYFDIESKATAITEEYADSIFMDVLCYNNDKERRKINNIDNSNLFSSFLTTIASSSTYNPAYDSFLYPSSNPFNSSPSSSTYPSHILSYIFTINSYGVLFKISSERQIVNVIQLESLSFSYSLDILYSSYFNNSLNFLKNEEDYDEDFEDEDDSHINYNYKRIDLDKKKRNVNDDYLVVGGDNGKILFYSLSTLTFLGHVPLPSPLNNNLNKKLIRDSNNYYASKKKISEIGDSIDYLDSFLNNNIVSDLNEDYYYPACYISLFLITPSRRNLSSSSTLNYFDLKLITVYSNAQLISFSFNDIKKIRKNFSLSYHTNLVNNIDTVSPSSSLTFFNNFFSFNDDYFNFLSNNKKNLDYLILKKEENNKHYISPLPSTSSNSYLSPTSSSPSSISPSSSIEYPSLFSLPPGTFITFASDDTIRFWNLNIDSQIKNSFLKSDLISPSVIKYIKKTSENSLLFSLNLNNFSHYSSFHLLEKENQEKENEAIGVDDSFMSSASTATNLSFYNNEKNNSIKNFFNYSCDYPNLEVNYRKNSSKFSVKFLHYNSFLDHLIIVDYNNVIKVYDILYNFNLLHIISYKKDKNYTTLASLSSSSEIISLFFSPILYTHDENNNWSFYTEKVNNLVSNNSIKNFKRACLMITSSKNGFVYIYDALNSYSHLITINNNFIPSSSSISNSNTSTSYISTVLFTHDGKKLVTVSNDNIINFYQIEKTLSSTSTDSNITYHGKNPSMTLKLIKKLLIKENKKINQIKIDFLNKFIILLVNFNEILIYNLNSYKLIRTYSFNFNTSSIGNNQLINFELDPSGLFIILYNHSFNSRNKKILFIDFFNGKIFFELNFFNEIIMNFKFTFQYLYLTTCNGNIKLYKLKKKLKIMILERLHELLVNKIEEDEDGEVLINSMEKNDEKESSLNDYYKNFLNQDLVNQLIYEYYQATLINKSTNKVNSKVFNENYNETELKMFKHLIEIIFKINNKLIKIPSLDKFLFLENDLEEKNEDQINKPSIVSPSLQPPSVSSSISPNISSIPNSISSISRSKWSIPSEPSIKLFGKEVRSSISNKKLTLELTTAPLLSQDVEDTEEEDHPNDDTVSEDEEKEENKEISSEKIVGKLDESISDKKSKRRGSESNINIMTSTYSNYTNDKLFSFDSSSSPTISPPLSPNNKSSLSHSSSKVIESNINNLEEWLEDIISNNENSTQEFLSKNEKILSKLKEIKKINQDSELVNKQEQEQDQEQVQENEDPNFKINESLRKIREFVQSNQEKVASESLNSSIDFNLTLSSVGKDDNLDISPSTSTSTSTSQAKSAKQSKSIQKDKQNISNPLFPSDSKALTSSISSISSTSDPERAIQEKTKELNNLLKTMNTLQESFIMNYNQLIEIRKENLRKNMEEVSSSTNFPPPPPPTSTSHSSFSPIENDSLSSNLDSFRKSFNQFNMINLLFLNSINNNDQFDYEAASSAAISSSSSPFFSSERDFDLISSLNLHEDFEKNKEITSDQFLHIISDKLKKSINFS